MSKQYVQHNSGQGEKWAVEDSSCEDCWHHYDERIRKTFYLPKSEYRLVEAPEVWKDVTEGCIFGKYRKNESDFLLLSARGLSNAMGLHRRTKGAVMLWHLFKLLDVILTLVMIVGWWL